MSQPVSSSIAPPHLWHILHLLFPFLLDEKKSWEVEVRAHEAPGGGAKKMSREAMRTPSAVPVGWFSEKSLHRVSRRRSSLVAASSLLASSAHFTTRLCQSCLFTLSAQFRVVVISRLLWSVDTRLMFSVLHASLLFLPLLLFSDFFHLFSHKILLSCANNRQEKES